MTERNFVFPVLETWNPTNVHVALCTREIKKTDSHEEIGNCVVALAHVPNGRILPNKAGTLCFYADQITFEAQPSWYASWYGTSAISLVLFELTTDGPQYLAAFNDASGLPINLGFGDIVIVLQNPVFPVYQATPAKWACGHGVSAPTETHCPVCIVFGRNVTAKKG